MTTFAELDEYLGLEFSPDAWADDAVLHALALVQGLTPDGWARVGAAWRSRPAVWQRRCAESLDWGDARHAVAVLVEMAQAADPEVVTAAADSLRGLRDDGVAVTLPPAAERRLEEVAARGGLTAVVIRALTHGARRDT